MTFFGGFLTLVICAALAAWFAGVLPSSKPVRVLEGEREEFSDPGQPQEKTVWTFVRNERFIRSFIINLCFAGIVMAATSRDVAPVAFWDCNSRHFWLLINLFLAVLCVSILKDDTSEIRKERLRICILLLIASFAVFGCSGVFVGAATTPLPIDRSVP